MLYNREFTLTWEFSEIEKIKSKVFFPIVIRTVSHKAWQCLSFPIPKALN
jgi:hypothetical protein